MSMWTYVIGAIHIDSCYMLPEDELRNKIESILLDAPAITGSEGNCQVDVVIKDGYNMSISKDCKRCPHKEDDEDFYNEPCEAPADYECPSGRYQTSAIISLCGDLRDRRIDYTAEEVNAFVEYVDKQFVIQNMSIKIEDGTEEIVRW